MKHPTPIEEGKWVKKDLTRSQLAKHEDRLKKGRVQAEARRQQQQQKLFDAYTTKRAWEKDGERMGE
jgi:hypothetical protein